jgi:hypothetical protein
MTVEEIDRLLQLWTSRIEAAAAGLAELRALPSYEILENLALTGETKSRIGPAIRAFDSVWRDYDLLSQTVQKAADMRAKISRFSISSQKWYEIEAILTGASVPANEQATIADRDLLTSNSAESGITLEQLLGRLNTAFQRGRDGVLEIDGAWKALDAKLSPAVAFLDSHRAESTAGMAELRAMVEALRPRVIHDPIGANREFDARIAPAFNRTRSAVEKLEAQRRTLPGDLAAARDLLKVLGECRGRNEQAFRECGEKVSGRSAEPALPSRRISEYGEILDGLEKLREEAEIDQACEQLESVTDELRRLLAEEERALGLNRAPLELRRELRGRLAALKAKAAARGRVEEPELARLAERASALLYSRPTPLDEAAGLVKEYEMRLNSRGRG